MEEYTLKEVSLHNQQDDCWVIIGKDTNDCPKVYDITNYLDDHPGGAEVLIDVSGNYADEFFEDIGHSSEARAELEKHQIGVLKCSQKDTAGRTVETDTVVRELPSLLPSCAQETRSSEDASETHEDTIAKSAGARERENVVRSASLAVRGATTTATKSTTNSDSREEISAAPLVSNDPLRVPEYSMCARDRALKRIAHLNTVSQDPSCGGITLSEMPLMMRADSCADQSTKVSAAEELDDAMDDKPDRGNRDMEVSKLDTESDDVSVREGIQQIFKEGVEEMEELAIWVSNLKKDLEILFHEYLKLDSWCGKWKGLMAAVLSGVPRAPPDRIEAASRLLDYPGYFQGLAEREASSRIQVLRGLFQRELFASLSAGAVEPDLCSADGQQGCSAPCMNPLRASIGEDMPDDSFSRESIDSFDSFHGRKRNTRILERLTRGLSDSVRANLLQETSEHENCVHTPAVMQDAFNTHDRLSLAINECKQSGGTFHQDRVKAAKDHASFVTRADRKKLQSIMTDHSSDRSIKVSSEEVGIEKAESDFTQREFRNRTASLCGAIHPDPLSSPDKTQTRKIHSVLETDVPTNSAGKVTNRGDNHSTKDLFDAMRQTRVDSVSGHSNGSGMGSLALGQDMVPISKIMEKLACLGIHAITEQQLNDFIKQVATCGGSFGGNEDDDNPPPLYKICAASAPVLWEKVQHSIAISKNSEADVDYRGKFGRTALHMICCSKQPQPQIIRTLLNVSANAVRIEDEFGFRPIHLACLHGASDEVLQMLLDVSSDLQISSIARGQDEGGRRVIDHPHSDVRKHDEDGSAVCPPALQPQSASVPGGLSPVASDGRHGARVGAIEAVILRLFLNDPDMRHFVLLESLARREWEKMQALLARVESSAEKVRLVESRENDVKATILHLVCCRNPPVEIVKILLKISTNLVKVRDYFGMLPIHVACLHRAHEDVISLLLEYYPESTGEKEQACARTPLHMLLQDIKQDGPPNAKSLRLVIKRNLVNVPNHEHDHSAILSFALQAKNVYVNHTFEVQNAKECVKAFLDVEPDGTSGLLAALQMMPAYLRNDAVIHQHTKHLLNTKISQKVPTAILFVDFYVHVLLIVSFALAVQEYFAKAGGFGGNGISGWHISFMYGGAVYLTLRETTQACSLAVAKVFNLWLWDFWNWLDVANICFTLSAAISMNAGAEADGIKALLIFTGGILWLKLAAFLKTVMLQFAVFVSGLIHVIWVLLPFVVTTGLVLGAFAQMYYIEATSSSVCSNEADDGALTFCFVGEAFLKTYSMFVAGGVEEEAFTGNTTSTWLTAVFAFVTVFLLLTVLIAIVTESYGTVKEQSEVVFWWHRFNYVFEVDALMNFLCCNSNRDEQKKRAKLQDEQYRLLFEIILLELKSGDYGAKAELQEKWKGPKWFFRNAWYDLINLPDQHWMKRWIRKAFLALFVPIWFIAGLVSMGWLWPPQVREYLLCPSIPDSPTHAHNDADDDVVRRSCNEHQGGMEELKISLLSALHKMESSMKDDSKSNMNTMYSVLRMDIELFREELKEVKAHQVVNVAAV